MSGPLYLERGGEQVFSPPYIAEDVQFFGFVVKADQSKLQAICDRYLNGPSGTEDFKALLPNVVFVFNRLGKMYSTSAADANRGWYSELEGAVWMPVWDSGRFKPLWYHPYMIVSSSYAMAMGREIYGFPKEFGWFNLPDGPDTTDPLAVEAVVAKELDPQCQATREQLFCAQIAANGKSDAAQPYTELADLSALAGEIAKGLGLDALLTAAVLNAHLTLPIPMVFLKQFRDAVNPELTCFQSVQETDTKLLRLLNLPRISLHQYEIVFQDWASHPIRSDLGLVAGPIPVELSFWTNFNFQIGDCTEISRAIV